MKKRNLYFFSALFIAVLLTCQSLLFDMSPSVLSAVGPEAYFVFTPIMPYAGEQVTFDASKSRGGDVDIISYNWDFGDETADTGVVVIKAYSSAGIYNFTLLVTNGFGESATKSSAITVVSQPQNLTIDLYSQRGGEGRNQESNGFSPGDFVELSALLEYCGMPVEHKPVSFEVRDAMGEPVTIRSDMTDENGVAKTNFTVVRECLSNIFGNWTAIAVSSVSEETVSDTLSFKVSGPYLDVYTQKPEPYSGKGTNQSSDAFAPQDEVILHGEAHYDCHPIEYKFVAFEITGPNGELVSARSNATDENGIATVALRLPSNATFGTYTVFATVEISEKNATDTLYFRVGWIIETLTFNVLNFAGVPAFLFNRGDQMCFNLTVKNIAFTPKIVTFTIVDYDAENVPLGIIFLKDFVVSPGSTTVFLTSIQLPGWAFTGNAQAFANAYTGLPMKGGVAYCPEVSTFFIILS